MWDAKHDTPFKGVDHSNTRPFPKVKSIPKELRKQLSKVVSFKDLKIWEDLVDDISAAGDELVPELEPAGSVDSTDSSCSIVRRAGVQKHKLILIMVGLPGRGKTFLCNKLKCYLNWLGHPTKHFNVGSYRRSQKDDVKVQDANFFDANNPAGREARHKAFLAALEDLERYMESEHGQVAIFDATNSTNERRQHLVNAFHGKWQYLFIETICTDEAILEQNYLHKLSYSPDYQGCSCEEALSDFKNRIRKYEEVYEPILNRNIHYIKLTDMVTGRGYMDINRISGYIPGKIVFFLMQVCKAGLANTRRIWLTRHGESEFNAKGLIGGDSSLSSSGEEYARQLPAVLFGRIHEVYTDDKPVSVSVLTSTLQRTIQTARYLPFPKLRWKALDEIDAGICDGKSYEEIAQQHPEEYRSRKLDKLRYRYPRGESYMDVIQRVEPVVTELERGRESICIVAHQAVLRAVYGYFMNIPPEQIPSVEMPLHTLIELTPMPDGTMSEQRFKVDVPGHASNGHHGHCMQAEELLQQQATAVEVA